MYQQCCCEDHCNWQAGCRNLQGDDDGIDNDDDDVGDEEDKIISVERGDDDDDDDDDEDKVLSVERGVWELIVSKSSALLAIKLGVSLLYRRTRCTLSTPGSSTSGRKGSSVILTAASGGETSLQDCVHKTWPVTTSRIPGSPSTSKLSTPSLWAWTRLCPISVDRSVQFSSTLHLHSQESL